MPKHGFFLAAACLDLARFLLLSLIAGDPACGVGNAHARIFLAYVGVPQLLFAVALVFLFLDGSRYPVYRPLLLAGKAASFPAGVALAALNSGLFPQAAELRAGPAARSACFAAVAMDIALFAFLLVPGRPESGAGDGTGSTRSVDDPIP